MDNGATSRQKLLIGIPSWAGLIPESQESFMRLVYRCGRELPDLDVAVEIITRKEQFRARNRLVDVAIAGGFDWLLMLDDDHIVPPDLVKRLLAHDKDVCGVLYYQRGGKYEPVILRILTQPDGAISTRFLRHNDPIITEPGLHQVDCIGGGCMLFRTDVFRKLRQPYFESEHVLGTDINICQRLTAAGVTIYCDTSIELGHVRDERQVITSRTVPLADREMAGINEDLWQDALGYTCMAPDELESACVQAGRREVRQAKWHDKDRSTWPDVLAFYQQYGDWHLHNLLLYNMGHREPTKEWALLRSQSMVPPNGQVIDMGCGLGHVALPLADRCGYRVHAYDLAGAATLPFVRYRLKKHALDLQENRHKGVILYEMEEPVPTISPPALVDGAFAISMIEHTFDPWGLLRWLAACVKPRGFLVCDYAVEKMVEEPQHLRGYDPATFSNEMAAIGWQESPEHRWLFLRQEELKLSARSPELAAMKVEAEYTRWYATQGGPCELEP